MIPDRIKQIVRSSAVTCVVVALCFLPYDTGASVAFAVTSGWVILNFLVWARLMTSALRPKDEPENPAGVAMALLSKLVLMGSGLGALFYFAPYTRMQVLGIAVGVGSVLLVTILKVVGAMLVSRPDTPAGVLNKGTAEKVLR